MNWTEIKNSIIEDLNTRNLKNPNIRINALNNLEGLLKSHFPDFIKDSQNKFKEVNKDEFKDKLGRYKENGKLNSAESSIVNEIYYRVK